jgi:phage terminase large subunit-like protein
MAIRIQLRRDTAAGWTAANPVLALGEPGYVTDTGQVKIGDGITDWENLSFSLTGPTGPAAENQIHPFLLMGA